MQPHRPLVIAHRGASAYLPEHTLEAYRLAIAQGADFIEPDVVPTRDGVLVCRHENALSTSTDVAAHPAFASRRCRKRIDGQWIEDWFAEDFTLAELRQLRARESMPAERPDNVRFDGAFCIPTFAEVVGLARDEGQRLGRPIGLYPETKHPTFFLHEGEFADGGGRMGLDTSAMLLDALVAEGFTDPARVFIQSFEVANLRRLKAELMPARGIALPLVQLTGDVTRAFRPGMTCFSRPYDVGFHAQRGDDMLALFGELCALPGGLDAHTDYGQLLSAEGLRLVASYAGVVAPWVASLWPEARTASWLSAASALGLAIHPYAVRTEPAFQLRLDAGMMLDADAQLERLWAMGAGAVFVDDPAHAVGWIARMHRGALPCA